MKSGKTAVDIQKRFEKTTDYHLFYVPSKQETTVHDDNERLRQSAGSPLIHN